MKVTVLDVNERPFVPEGLEFFVDENSVKGVLLDNSLEALDPDAADVGQLQFGIEDDGELPFEIVNNKLRVRLKDVLDFEVLNSYTFSVTASDTGWDGRGVQRHTQDVTVFVVDVNEKPQWTDTNIRDAEENSLVSTEIGVPVNVQDQDLNTVLVIERRKK